MSVLITCTLPDSSIKISTQIGLVKFQDKAKCMAIPDLRSLSFEVIQFSNVVIKFPKMTVDISANGCKHARLSTAVRYLLTEHDFGGLSNKEPMCNYA